MHKNRNNLIATFSLVFSILAIVFFFLAYEGYNEIIEKTSLINTDLNNQLKESGGGNGALDKDRFFTYLVYPPNAPYPRTYDYYAQRMHDAEILMVCGIFFIIFSIILQLVQVQYHSSAET